MVHYATNANFLRRNTSARIASFAALVLMSVCLCGCPKSTKSLATASDTIAHALANAQQAVAIGQSDGVVSAKDAATFNEYVSKVAQAGLVIDQGIRAGDNAQTLSPKVNAFLDAFNALNTQGLLAVKDPKVQLAISTALTGAESAVAIIAATVGGKQ